MKTNVTIFQHKNRCQLRQDLCSQPPAQLSAQHPRVRPEALRCLSHPALSSPLSPAGKQTRTALQGKLNAGEDRQEGRELLNNKYF